MNETTTGDNGMRTPAASSVLDDPMRNRGVAFTVAEREALGLTGRLPSVVLTLDQQAQRACKQLQAKGSDLAKNVYMEQLHDRVSAGTRRVVARGLVPHARHYRGRRGCCCCCPTRFVPGPPAPGSR